MPHVGGDDIVGEISGVVRAVAVWMLRLMIVFWVQCLADVRAQAVSQAASPDILEPSGTGAGAGAVTIITRYYYNTDHTNELIFTNYFLVLAILELVFLPGGRAGEWKSWMVPRQIWSEVKSTNIVQHFRWERGESQAQLQAPPRPTCPLPEIENIWEIGKKNILLY